MTTYTKPGTFGDLLLSKISDEFNLASATVKMPASGGPHNAAQVAGMPGVWDATNKRVTLSLNAAIGSATALVLWGPKITAQADDNEEADKYTVLVDFEGVVINKNAIPLTDSAGTSITLATLVTQLESLGAKVVADPVKKTTQTS